MLNITSNPLGIVGAHELVFPGVLFRILGRLTSATQSRAADHKELA